MCYPGLAGRFDKEEPIGIPFHKRQLARVGSKEEVVVCGMYERTSLSCDEEVVEYGEGFVVRTRRTSLPPSEAKRA